MPLEETVIISVGGSLIVPDKVDTDFLTSFTHLIAEEVGRGKRFMIITGGGKTARRYQEAAAAVSDLTAEDLDWLGIHATRLNAHLLRAVFRDIAHPVVVKNPHEDLDATASVIIAAGWRPGRSTDYVATLFAQQLGAQKLINLSNIDYVYTDDPRTNPDAEKIEQMSWSDFRKLIPSEWDPGLSSPFDPVASKEAERLGLEVAIINGTKLSELTHYLNDKPFVGTKIR